MKKPAITCLCPTHGRAHIIGEAIESYLRQDPCGVETELLIVNDCPEQPLDVSAPGVRVVNIYEPIPDYSLKMNKAVELAAGDLIAWWEDDDISLPFRLRMSFPWIERGFEYYKQSRAWMWQSGIIEGRPHNLFFGSGLFRKAYYFECGGATEGIPGDASAHVNMMRGGGMHEREPAIHETFFMYRWAGMGHHDSGVAGTNADRFNSFRYRTLTDARFVPGIQHVRPEWKQDYCALVDESISRGATE